MWQGIARWGSDHPEMIAYMIGGLIAALGGPYTPAQFALMGRTRRLFIGTISCFSCDVPKLVRVWSGQPLESTVVETKITVSTLPPPMPIEVPMPKIPTDIPVTIDMSPKDTLTKGPPRP